MREAVATEIPQLARVLTDAFDADPVYHWMLPDTRRLRSRPRAMFTAEMQQYVLGNGGTVWTNPELDGACCVLPPDAWEMPTSFTGRETLPWLWAFGTRFPRAIRLQRAMEVRHLSEPHLYVRIIGVASARQGQGIGSALMAPALARADEAGLPMYLEASSERSAALYERLGFEYREVLHLPGGGPSLWPMRRPPTPSPGSTA